MTLMLRSAAAVAGLASILLLGIHTPASAQPTTCGYYDNYGTWIATRCGPAHHARSAVSGTIVGVDGNMLTLANGPRTVIVNDQPALNRYATGHIYTGRFITAYGYWRYGQFVATSIG